jgi:hypothetical protein
MEENAKKRHSKLRWNLLSQGVKTPGTKKQRINEKYSVTQQSNKDSNISDQTNNDSIKEQTPFETLRKRQEPVERLIEAMMSEIEQQTGNDIEGKYSASKPCFKIGKRIYTHSWHSNQLLTQCICIKQ